jgi:hypothetical protein
VFFTMALIFQIGQPRRVVPTAGIGTLVYQVAEASQGRSLHLSG